MTKGTRFVDATQRNSPWKRNMHNRILLELYLYLLFVFPLFLSCLSDIPNMFSKDHFLDDKNRISSRSLIMCFVLYFPFCLPPPFLNFFRPQLATVVKIRYIQVSFVS